MADIATLVLEEFFGELQGPEDAQRWLLALAYDLGAGRLSANDASDTLDAVQVWLELYEESESGS